jgi:hypothetical protein
VALPLRIVRWAYCTNPRRTACLLGRLDQGAGYLAGRRSLRLFAIIHRRDLLVTIRPLSSRRDAFDSRWHWNVEERNHRFSAQDESQDTLARRIAEAVRRATGADFAVAGRIANLGETPVTGGVTRAADLAPLFYGHKIDLLEMSGAELLEAQNRLTKKSDNSRSRRNISTWI